MSERVKTARNAQSARKRSAGRPTEHTVVGKEAIIAATIDLMKTTSVQELRISEVATAAGVDPALIRYYFSNKKGLIRAVAADLMEDVQARSKAMLGLRGPLDFRIRTRLSLLIETLSKNPRFLQAVLNEIYAGEDSPERTETLKHQASQGLALSEALLRTTEEDPPIRPVDPRMLHIVILGMCTFFTDAQPMIRMLFADETDQQSLEQRYIDFATTLLLEGLKKS